MPLFRNWRKKEPELNSERIAGAHGDILLHSLGTAFNLTIVSLRTRYFHESHNFTQETSKTIKIPNWTTLFFYCPINSTVFVTLSKLMVGLYKPVDVYGPGQSTHQYILFSVFDYELVTKICQRAMLVSHNIQKQNKKVDPFDLYDIAYVAGGDIYSLSDFINELYSKGKIYQRIHCLFDRVSFGVDKSTVPIHGFKEIPTTIIQEDLGRWNMIIT